MNVQEPQQPRVRGGDDKGPKQKRSGGPWRSQNAVADRQNSDTEEDEENDDKEPEAGNY